MLHSSSSPQKVFRRFGGPLYARTLDWTGVPLFSLWVMAKSGAAQYFQSVFIAFCHTAGRGVPLHTLMLIWVTKRKCLANDYSVVKEQPRFRHTKENWVGGFLSSHPVADGKVRFWTLPQNIFNFFLQALHPLINGLLI